MALCISRVNGQPYQQPIMLVVDSYLLRCGDVSVSVAFAGGGFHYAAFGPKTCRCDECPWHDEAAAEIGHARQFW